MQQRKEVRNRIWQKDNELHEIKIIGSCSYYHRKCSSGQLRKSQEKENTRGRGMMQDMRERSTEKMIVDAKIGGNHQEWGYRDSEVQAKSSWTGR